MHRQHRRDRVGTDMAIKRLHNKRRSVVEEDSDLFDMRESIDEIQPMDGHYYVGGRGFFEVPYDAESDVSFEDLDQDLFTEDEEDFATTSNDDLDLKAIQDAMITLSPRWQAVPWTSKQRDLVDCLSRFITIAAGRRSGKTEIAKRKLVKRALAFTAFPDGWFVAAAPTRDQAKRIFWKDLKALCPASLVMKVSESDLTITLWNGCVIQVMGLEVPERVEGTPLDGIIIDECATVKPSVWKAHVRPALATIGRPGWAILFGVPEGRNHFYHLCNKSKTNEGWNHFHWPSSDVLSVEEIEEMKRDLDPLTYDQEANASFVNFEGRAYYPYEEHSHTRTNLPYNDRAELVFCFDFNVSPGTATVLQEIRNENKVFGKAVADQFTGILGEVWIPKNSNTRSVCRKLIKDWGHHKGKILVYGDATGGNKGSAKTEGSDWDLVKAELYAHFGTDRVIMKVPKANPRERSRVNAMNTRLQATNGVISMLVDNSRCPHVCLDLEGVTTLKGGSGELDKKADEELTHLSDGFGYYVEKEFPVRGKSKASFTQVVF